MSCQLEVLKSKYDEALEARKQTERHIETLRPVINEEKIINCLIMFLE